jgi:4-amino-4-deoxy-L-arabinose transferase-like glycosyltransferase
LGYVVSKTGAGLASTAAYAAGHILAAAALLMLWRGGFLRRSLARARELASNLFARPRYVLLLVAGLTLLRLAWIALVPTQPTSDHAVYHGLAVRLVETGVYDAKKHRAYWPPGYPVFLAALYALFGTSVWVAKVANVLLAAGADLVAWLAVRRHVGAAAAAIALVLTAAWPGRNFHVDVLSYDELVIVLVLASIACMPKPPASRLKVASWLASGLALGLACLVRPTLGLAPVAVGAYLLVARVPWRRAVLCTVTYMVAMLVPIVPWTVRNYRVLGRFIPLTTNAGGNFYNSWAPGGTGSFYKPAWEQLQAATGGDELKISPTGFALGWAAIRDAPAHAAWRVVQKQVHYLGSDNWLLPVESYAAALGGNAAVGAALKAVLHTLSNGWYLVLLVWPLISLRVSTRRLIEQPLAWFSLCVFFLGLITHTVFEAQARYHLIYLPLWSIMLATLAPAASSRSAPVLCR